ncbi:MAG: DUF2971 domain-containing protein [PVC group bacterium]|nr:DUF2971 domain-containing protein [PVC group bacterium]
MSLIDNMNSAAPESDYLFHYTKTSTAVEHILYEKKLRFTPLSKMHDPLEFLDAYHSAYSMEGVDRNKLEKLYTRDLDINEIVRRKFRVACFCKDMELYECHNSGINFNRGWARSRMWSQYAEGHAGICIVFSKKSLLKNITQEVKRKVSEHKTVILNESVKYDNTLMERAEALHISLDGNGLNKSPLEWIKEHSKEYLFKKLVDYKDEQEYRFAIYHESFLSNTYTDICFGDSILAIILGVKFPPAYKVNIEDCIKRIGCECAEMYWHGGKPFLFNYPTSFL